MLSVSRGLHLCRLGSVRIWIENSLRATGQDKVISSPCFLPARAVGHGWKEMAAQIALARIYLCSWELHAGGVWVRLLRCLTAGGLWFGGFPLPLGLPGGLTSLSPLLYPTSPSHQVPASCWLTLPGRRPQSRSVLSPLHMSAHHLDSWASSFLSPSCIGVFWNFPGGLRGVSARGGT